MAEIRRTFHQALEDVQQDIVRLGAMVTEILPRGTEALLAGDLQEATRIIDFDDEIDALTIDLEERCYQLLALQQPMASDLRRIVTALWLTSEIERSGDLVVNTMKATRRIYGVEIDPKMRRLIEQMNDEALRLFRLAIDAYADGNASLAASIDDMDDRLDDLHNDYIQAIFESRSAETLELQAAVQLALIGRYYERIGDHAVNIGERAHYMVTGWMPEHTGAARIEAKSVAKAKEAAVPADGAGA